MENYYYVSGKMGMTSSGSFSRDKSRWVKFTKNEAETIKKPYGATKTGRYVRSNLY